MRQARGIAPTPMRPKAKPEPPPHHPTKPVLVVTEGQRRIFAAPSWKADVLGTTRAGQRLPLRRGEPLAPEAAQTCAGGWFEVAPRGYICAPDDAIRDPKDPRIRAIAASLPRDEAYPLDYGTALGASRFRRFPRQDELRPHERKPSAAFPTSTTAPPKTLVEWLASRGGALRDGTAAYPGMKLAWSGRFLHDGRAWLLTPDQLLVPANQVKPARPLAAKRFDVTRLPFAVVLQPTHAYVDDDGRLQRDDATLGVGTVIALQSPATGVWRAGRGLWPTTDGRWLPRNGIALFRKRSPPQAHEAGEKWIHVSVHGGSLVAYEDQTPVFAALMSPGLGGTQKDHAFRTPPGVYRVGAKWLTADMGGPLGDTGHRWRTREVPWVAYYDGSFAIHGAWWHDAFGRPRSHGCINLTPPDARHLFAWMDPVLPEGWYAVRGDTEHPGTLLWVTP